MKALIYIIDNLRVAGAQRHLLKLISGLSNTNYSIGIICLGTKDENLVKGLNAPVITFKMDCIWQPGFWLDFVRLIQFLSKNKPSLVHTYLNTSNVFGVLAAKLAGVPIAISSRRDLGQFRSGIIGLLERFTARLSDRVICVSQAVQRKVSDLDGLPEDKLTVIYNGVEITGSPSHQVTRSQVKESIGIGDDELVVGMIATMDREEKGHREFIEAAALVVKEIPNVKFLLIGDGYLRKSYELRAISSGYKDKIMFLGKRSDVSELLSIMDVSVNASYSEGMSNTILESMAAGVPVVATAVDGNLETIEDGETGFLVTPKDPGAIAQAAIKILKDKELAKKIGENARKLVSEKFSLDKMVKNYVELYEVLINPRQSATDTSAVIRVKNNPRSSAPKLGYIVSLFPCWSETFILNEIIELEKRGFNVTIFSIRKDLEKFTQDKARQFIRNTKYVYVLKAITSVVYWLLKRPLLFIPLLSIVLNKKYSSIKEAFKNTYAFFSGCYFASIARKERLTHIHAHFATYPALTAMVMSKLTDIPFTFTTHAHDIFLEKTLLKEKVRAAKAIIAISDYNKRYIRNYCQNGICSKVKVIHCGLDLAEFINLNARHKENSVLSVGRLTKMKGFEYLIRACSRLRNHIPIQCRIIGDGPLRDELERLIINLGARSYIRIEGVLDNNRIKHLMHDSTAFILPSVWDKQDGQDGIPVVLMEAMASGIPVVSSSISGIPELIEDGKTGLLAEPGNIDQLSQKILQLLSDKEMQSRLSQAGRRKVEEEFNIEKSVEKLIRVFSS